MADIFISFKTDDTPRVQAVRDGFRARGLDVFWSNDIPKGAPNYQAIIKDEILKAPVVVVVWTNRSVHSGPVIQECSQAEKANKLFQILLDDIEPIDMPMEVKYKSQKTILLGWTGDRSHTEWTKLNNAIDVRLGRQVSILPPPSSRAQFIPQALPSRLPLPSTDPYKAVAHVARTPFKDISIGPELVTVPAGRFMMGEGNVQRNVTISKPLAIGRFPVTFAEWDAAGLDYEPDDYGWGRGQRPVIFVSWQDTQAYLAWLSKEAGKAYRLLTEAEWEYCCRAGTTTAYSFGDSITKRQARFSKGFFGNPEQVIEVGTFPANDWGLSDMHGNVREWCEDIWHEDYVDAPTDSSAWLRGGDANRRVIRGGSWLTKNQSVRSASRDSAGSGTRQIDLGFRVARAIIS